MKVKIQAILTGVPQDDIAYTRVVRDMPEIIDPQDKTNARLGPDASRYETHLASQIRTMSFSYQVPAIQRTPAPTGDYEDEHDGEQRHDGIESLTRSDNGMIDPRLTGTSLDTENFGQETVQAEMVADEETLDMPDDHSIRTP